MSVARFDDGRRAPRLEPTARAGHVHASHRPCSSEPVAFDRARCPVPDFAPLVYRPGTGDATTSGLVPRPRRAPAARLPGERPLLQSAIFLDKDGTLIDDVPFNVDPAHVRLAPSAAPALPLLAAAGYALVVVSNQSGLAEGRFDAAALGGALARVAELAHDAGAPLAAFYCCPHAPWGRVRRWATACECRKPGPGLLLAAAHDLGLDLARSWLIGDILDDVEAGLRAGCRTVLLEPGGETEWRLAPDRVPHHRARDLEDAARAVLAVAERDRARRSPRSTALGGRGRR